VQNNNHQDLMNNDKKASEVSGLLLLDKSAGLTSFEALGAVKRSLGTKKVGHTGTLDKFAEGLMLVLTGRALRLSTWFTHCDKHYEAVACFGSETDTLDPEGKVIAEAGIPSQEAVLKVLPGFTGNIMQAPPAYSAIHIDGIRASALARSGASPEMKERAVTIFALELKSWEPPFALFHVHCSSGTYIRSLARDLALAANSRAHLSGLKRTKVAGFDLINAVRCGEGVDSVHELQAALQPIDKSVFAALGIPCFDVDERSVQKIIQGKPLSGIVVDDLDGAVTASIFCGGNFIAIIEKKDTVWKYGYVYAHN
jgi:tRNA pseudouridine55 synthase